MKKDQEELVQCRGIKEATRDRCKKRTRDSSGYCKQHRVQINEETEFTILKCAVCPVKDCKYRDHFTEGICYFEVSDTVKDFDTQWKTLQAMREMLRNERLIIGRLEREISHKNFANIGQEEDTTKDLLKELKDFTTIHSSHMLHFGKFMGYKAVKSDDEQKEEKGKRLEKLMSKEKHKDAEKEKKDKEKEDVEKEIEVEVKEIVKK